MNYQQFLNKDNPVCKITVAGYGDMEVELFSDIAPITVKNFLDLVKEKFYDGLIFHRVIEGFMIQGGDPTKTGMGGSKDKIKGEFKANKINNPIQHSKGVISMARTSAYDSASSQFFLMHEDAPHLDGLYAAFGVVTKGMDVIDKIASVKTNPMDRPIEDVVITRIERIR